jgi:hypothetical protein
MLEDLGKDIQHWRENRDQTVLIMDCNENVSNPAMSDWLQGLGLRNSILDFHNIQTNTIPIFHKGSYAINGIFISNTIHITKGGYMTFGTFSSNHRGLWIDIAYETAFGYNMRVVISSTCRLKSDDPRIWHKWTALYTQYLQSHKLPQRQFKLERELSSPITNREILECESIRRIQDEGIKYADKRCHKLNMGSVLFSDEYNLLTNTIELWAAVITKKGRCKYSMSKLLHLSKKTNILNPLHVTLKEAQDNLNTAKQKYWEFKNTA